MNADFEPKEKFPWESHSAAMRRKDADVYVSADSRAHTIRIAAQGHDVGFSLRLSRAEASALASQLFAAVNSLHDQT